MVILVRCIDQTVSVALASKLEFLIREGLITAYLQADGWVAAQGTETRVRNYPASAEKSRRTAFVSCF